MPEEANSNGLTCSAITQAGKRCRAAPMAGGLCFLHANPARASELGRVGGRKNRHSVRVDASSVTTVPRSAAEIRILLADVIAQVKAGRLEPKIGTSVAYIAGPLLRAIEIADLEGRLQKLELDHANASTEKNRKP